MSFLTAAQSAAIRLIGRKPTTFFSSPGIFELELTDLANEIAADLVKYTDWRRLVTLKQMPGDGTTVGFDLPSDYDRMPVSQEVGRANWYTWGYMDAPNLNFWRDLVNGLTSPNPGYWIMLDGQMQFLPPIPVDTTAEYYYISRNIVVDGSGGDNKATFTQDSDSLLINERLMTLGLIWRWRAQKRLEYAEDLQNYEILAAQESGSDRGSSILRAGRRIFVSGAQYAYPRALGS